MDGYGDDPIIRILDGDSIIESPLSGVSVDEIAAARPIRALSWYSGQRSFPGWYWSSTVGAHVPYDSRLELARLLLADFDCSVEIIVAQPFQLVGAIGCKVCRHVPDFLLVRRDRTVTVVNVKTEMALEKQEYEEHSSGLRKFCPDGVGITRCGREAIRRSSRMCGFSQGFAARTTRLPYWRLSKAEPRPQFS
ncbi:TnsA-like heteromeric transposase endonuclease subunit [Rhodococcus erythropolis]